MRMTKLLEDLDLRVEVVLHLALELPKFDGFDSDSGAGSLRGIGKLVLTLLTAFESHGQRAKDKTVSETQLHQAKKYCHFGIADRHGYKLRLRERGTDLVSTNVDRGEAALADLGTNGPLAHSIGLGPRAPRSGGLRSHFFLRELTRQEDSCVDVEPVGLKG